MKKKAGVVVMGMGVLLGGRVQAAGMGFEAASSDTGDVQAYRLVADWDLQKHWFPRGNWYLNAYLEADVSFWNGKSGDQDNDSLGEVGFTPILLRWQKDPKAGGFAPFIEWGEGVHVLSDPGIADQDLGVLLQFGSHAGLGARFGQDGRYELAYRFQHLSNAGIGDDNDGINFHFLRFVYWMP